MVVERALLLRSALVSDPWFRLGGEAERGAASEGGTRHHAAPPREADLKTRSRFVHHGGRGWGTHSLAGALARERSGRVHPRTRGRVRWWLGLMLAACIHLCATRALAQLGHELPLDACVEHLSDDEVEQQLSFVERSLAKQRLGRPLVDGLEWLQRVQPGLRLYRYAPADTQLAADSWLVALRLEQVCCLWRTRASSCRCQCMYAYHRLSKLPSDIPQQRRLQIGDAASAWSTGLRVWRPPTPTGWPTWCGLRQQVRHSQHRLRVDPQSPTPTSSPLARWCCSSPPPRCRRADVLDHAATSPARPEGSARTDLLIPLLRAARRREQRACLDQADLLSAARWRAGGALLMPCRLRGRQRVFLGERPVGRAVAGGRYSWPGAHVAEDGSDAGCWPRRWCRIAARHRDRTRGPDIRRPRQMAGELDVSVRMLGDATNCGSPLTMPVPVVPPRTRL